jgi:hypothetical protein
VTTKHSDHQASFSDLRRPDPLAEVAGLDIRVGRPGEGASFPGDPSANAAADGVREKEAR